MTNTGSSSSGSWDAKKLTSLIWNDRLANVGSFLPSTATAADSNGNGGGSSQQKQQQQQQQQQQEPLPASSSSYHRSGSNFDYSHTGTGTGTGSYQQQQQQQEQPEEQQGTSTMVVATFNLVATIVGGGELSVPFAFSKMGGVLYGILWMLLAAICTDQSCLMLCWAARPATETTTSTYTTTEASSITKRLLSSYGQVGKKAFGPVLEVAISALLFVFLVFVLVAYMVLAKDIWTPIVLALLLPHSTNTNNPAELLQHQQDDDEWGPYVLLGIVLLMLPFFVQHTLHALRFNCYVGFFSVSTLCLALCHHAMFPPQSDTTINSNMTTSTTRTTTSVSDIVWTYEFWLRPPDSIRDVLMSFPILMLSLLCHFNINPIQKALIHPTPQRIEWVIHAAVIACTILMIAFGVGGYAYVMVDPNTANIVQGNILLNAEEQQATYSGVDFFLYVGRIGCGITVLMAQCVMMLPCRDSLLEVADIAIFSSTTLTAANRKQQQLLRQQQQQQQQYYDKDQDDETENKEASEETPLVTTDYNNDDDDNENDDGGSLSRHTKNNNNNNKQAVFLSIRPHSLSESTFIHYTVTLMITAVSYVFAISVPGVAIVWSLCGSSMAFSIAFILPAACYLELMFYRHDHQQQQNHHHQQQQSNGNKPSKVFAWALLVFSIVGAIVCTIQTVQSMVV